MNERRSTMDDYKICTLADFSNTTLRVKEDIEEWSYDISSGLWEWLWKQESSINIYYLLEKKPDKYVLDAILDLEFGKVYPLYTNKKTGKVYLSNDPVYEKNMQQKYTKIFFMMQGEKTEIIRNL